MENPTYLEKLGERIEGHIKVDEAPATKHEKIINYALMKMWQVGRQLPEEQRTQNRDTNLILSRNSLNE